VSRLPRILPLIGVAIAGVFAVNALAGARNLPDLVSAARAFAETAPPKPAKAAAKTSADKPVQLASAAAAPNTARAASAVPPQTATAMSPAPGGALPANADALCLASRAGLSPAEMKMIQDLQTRRGQLDQRESDLDLQLKLVEAAEAKLNTKLNDLNGLKSDISKLLGQVDDKQATETARLVKVYATMKPQQAAADLAVLSDEVRLPIVTSPAMKEAVLSAILNKMPTAAAKDLTEKMAQRFAAANVVNQAKAATAAAAAGVTPPAPATPAATPKPKGQAAAAPPPVALTPAATPADPKTADAAPAKPKKVASAAKRKTPTKAKTPNASDAAAPMATKPDPTATG
jgi:flagellar motility protein MotE (MotC chaperone)